ncbi:MAG TPA: hypothetical protein VGD59_13425 [Acidisarcina sp.]
MTCNEAAQFVSALYDGEVVPAGAAEHVRTCEGCQARLRSYSELGMELRRMASADLVAEVAPRTWNKPQPALSSWWHRGWQSMRIPRLALVTLLTIILVLGSALAVVTVRAHGHGDVVMLKVTPAPGVSNLCALSTQDKKWGQCAFIGGVNHQILSYQINLIGKDKDRVELGFRSRLDPVGGGTYTLAALESAPERQYWFEPGETLQLDAPGLGQIEVTGEWMDHMPAVVGTGNHDLDPGANELRIMLPMLLHGKQVIGDVEGGSATVLKADQEVILYMPGYGLFHFSLSPVAGAVRGDVRFNKISFESGGESYVLVTGAPITRSEQVWVLREPNYKPSPDEASSAFIGSGETNQATR